MHQTFLLQIFHSTLVRRSYLEEVCYLVKAFSLTYEYHSLVMYIDATQNDYAFSENISRSFRPYNHMFQIHTYICCQIIPAIVRNWSLLVVPGLQTGAKAMYSHSLQSTSSTKHSMSPHLRIRKSFFDNYGFLLLSRKPTY